MGGPCRVRIECPQDTQGAPEIQEPQARAALAAVEAEVARLERRYSRYREDSLVSEINRAAGSGRPVAIDPETAGLLNYADTLWRESGGLFDLTSGVLRRAWDFRTGRPPEQEQLDRLLPLVDWQSVTWDESQVALPRAGMELDFGGCVKEYACDSAAAVLRRHGIRHALVDLAGDMAAVGPRADGTLWRVGIRRPGERDSAIATIELGAGGLASSGDYERCLEIDGIRYGHILNPHTGWPQRGTGGGQRPGAPVPGGGQQRHHRHAQARRPGPGLAG